MNQGISAPQRLSPAAPHNHFVQFYEEESFLIEEVSGFLETGLRAGQGGVVIATRPHLDQLAARMKSRGVAIKYLALDADETLSRILTDGYPDERLFEDVIGAVMRRVSHQGRRKVCAFGEMVALLAEEGRHEAAIRLEELWNDLAHTYAFGLLCAYPLKNFQDAEHGDSFTRICEAHAHVHPAESYVETVTSDELLREVARLQQKAAALENEIEKRRQAEQDLRRRERVLSDFLENAVEGLHQVGADGTILWANRAELEMLGYEPDQYIGHPIAEFYVDRETIDDILAKLARRETLYNHPARLRCADGSIKHVLIHSNVLFENGEFIHTRCFTRDVTDKVRLEMDLQNGIEQLAELDRRKDQFLAMLGHELRNPLAAIVTGVEVMRRRSDDADSNRRVLEILARQSATMSRLVDDLLDISRISRGKITLRKETLQLATLVERAVELVRPLIDERGHRLTLGLPAEPVSVFGDDARLVQLLSNLLHNAAKYTEAGGNIWLNASVDGTDLLLCVRDDGVGLTPELCEQVFEAFVQAPGALEQARGGLGIGLTLVRNLVGLHGGTVQAFSDGPGRGCEFVIRLPLRGEADGDPGNQA